MVPTGCVCCTWPAHYLNVLYYVILPDIHAIVYHITGCMNFPDFSFPTLGRQALACWWFSGSAYRQRFGVVAGWGPVPVYLSAIMTAIVTWMATWFIISLMPSESAISVQLMKAITARKHYSILKYSLIELTDRKNCILIWLNMSPTSIDMLIFLRIQDWLELYQLAALVDFLIWYVALFCYPPLLLDLSQCQELHHCQHLQD